MARPSLPSGRIGGWPPAAFAVSQSDFSSKTEAYEILRHPEGGRKDIFRWAGQDEKPVVELEIHRPGGELGPSHSAVVGDHHRKSPAERRALIGATGKALVFMQLFPLP